MKRVQGTTVEFLCEEDEVVTIDITENNTTSLFSYSPHANHITQTDNQLTINVGNSKKIVTLAFDFNGTNGSYNLVLNGSKGDESFTRNISQPSDDGPSTRTYIFHVS